MRTAAPETSYDPSFFAPLAAIEDRHFWFRARNRVIHTLVRQITAQLEPGYRVLEVGCGNGNVLHVLEEACGDGVVVGMDLFHEALEFAARRSGCLLVQGDMNAPPFRGVFDLIGLFDVLEHMADDLQVLRSLHEMLAPGAVLLLTVPAHASLWSYFDEASHHYRRYELAELEGKLTNAGYCVEYISPYMASIVPLVWLGRRLVALSNRSGGKGTQDSYHLAAQELRILPVVNDLLSYLLGSEARLVARRRRLPMGTSLLALARGESAQPQ